MTTFEIRAGALAVLVQDVDDELAAVETAVEGDVLHDGDAVSVVEYDGRPVGADGVDPEEPEE